MSLVSGDRVGAYEVLGLLGAGGMGEVYRVRDPRLGRDVAIKVLPPAFSGDSGRLARFEQEARAAAALNHPNILNVYDIGQHDGAPYIVSELLEGKTLRDRLTPGDEGPAPDATGAGLLVRKALAYAVQLARGLAAAHDKGIVHRDLKPENVFVTTDERVKILDFGLAKLTQTDSASAGASDQATRSKAKTDVGMVLGTVGYMAPEQVRGLAADHRSDIFAFGVVLYEMLSGRRAFRRDTAIDTMTAILKEDLPELTGTIPPALARIVERCLEKDPASRFQSTRDLAFALEALSSHSDTAPALTTALPAPPVTTRRDRLAWGLVSVLGGVLVAALGLGAIAYFGRAPAAVEATRFFVAPPEGWALARQTQGQPAVGPLAVAPDGRRVAFVARNASGGTLIWLRSLDTLTAQGLAGTEGAASPFWSPDSRWLAFFSGGKLKKIDVAGGPPVTLCDAAPGVSGAWSRDGVIVFSPAGGTALQKVSASGGVPTPATVLGEGETGHSRPAFLPDGQHFIYRGLSAATVRTPVFVASLGSAERTRLLEADSTNVLYSQRHLLFLREATLMAQPFDPDRLALAGESFPVAEQIQIFGSPPYGFFSVSDSGVLAYQTGTTPGAPQLTWIDRTGKALTTVGAPAFYADVALSPDGRRALISLPDPGPGSSDVWLLDLERDGLPTRFTFDAATDGSPVWSPDGSRVIFGSNRTGSLDLYEKASSGAGTENLLLADDGESFPTSWSTDGRFLFYTSVKGNANDIWVLPLSGDRKPFPFLQTPAAELNGRFSPDGRWIAYTSFESGRAEVYVAPFSGSGGASGGKWQVSTGGGSLPRWRQDGREIFYITPPPDSRVMAAAVSAQDTAFNVGALEPLFAFRGPGTPRSPYDVSPDGRRFLVNMAPEVTAVPTPITVVVNWTAGVKK